MESQATHTQLIRLTEVLPELREITLYFMSVPVSSELNAFLMAHTNLERLVVTFRSYRWTGYDLVESIPMEWYLVENQNKDSGVTLVFVPGGKM